MIAFVLGTRPEAIKLAPLIRRIPAEERCLIYTGQHYDQALAFDVWADCGGYEFQHILKVVGQTDAERLGSLVSQLAGGILAGIRFPSIGLEAQRPRWVVVQGDTTSALAGALAAAKLDIPVYHVEAGSRSGDKQQPEEMNRKVIDQVASGHACSYHCDAANLRREGIMCHLWSGDIAIDALLADGLPAIEPGDAVVVTIHRDETLRNAEAVKQITAFMRDLAREQPVVFYRHPHTAQVMTDDLLRGVDAREPIPPGEFRQEMARARAVVTDSGGAAIEAAYMGIPCVIAREVTELADLAECGRVVIGGRERETLWKAWGEAQRNAPTSEKVQHAWKGRASECLAERLMA